jgi:hypothetical protein
MVLTGSAQDNRFKEAWEFGGLRRRNGGRSWAGLMVHLSNDKTAGEANVFQCGLACTSQLV